MAVTLDTVSLEYAFSHPANSTSGDFLPALTANTSLTNTSFNNDTHADTLYEVTTGIVVLLSLLYGSISLVTVLGNLLVILVIFKNQSMRTVTNFYIANLSFADVIIGILGIPFQFQAALLQRWDLPHFLCPVAPFVKELTVNVSIITLAVISLDRYRAVIHPLKPRCSRRIAHIVMAVVWSFSLIVASPAAVVFRVIWIQEEGQRKPFCFPKFPELNGVDLGGPYRLGLVIIQYFFPLLIICFAYICIIHKIWLTKAPGLAVDSRDQIMNRNKRKVIRMLIVVVALFAFCWLPLQTYNLLSEITAEVNNYKYINIIWLCSNWLAMSNSCYNPFIYGLLNEKFKHAFRVLFYKCPCTCCRRGVVKDLYLDPSDDGLRKSSVSGFRESSRIQMNNGRIRRYLKVQTNSFSTDSSFV